MTNNRKKSRLRAEAFRDNVEKKRARFIADCERLGKCPTRGRNTYKNGCWPGRYGVWGRLSSRSASATCGTKRQVP